MTSSIPATVVIATVGRPEQLRACLASVTACNPPAAEVLVVDQSRNGGVTAVVDEFAAAGARRVECPGRGRALASNLGLEQAGHELVLLTDDDCTVAPDWVGAAARHLERDPAAVVTGRVLAMGDPDAVPSTIDAEEPRDYTGETSCGALYAGNMAARRSDLLAVGGFDPRLQLAGADNDLCYRWLRDGRALRFEPDLVVWHHDWRTPEQLTALYRRYARGQGILYGKHLRQGDLRMLRFIARDLYLAARGLAARLLRGRPPSSDWRQAILPGTARGIAEGWRMFRPAGD